MNAKDDAQSPKQGDRLARGERQRRENRFSNNEGRDRRSGSHFSHEDDTRRFSPRSSHPHYPRYEENRQEGTYEQGRTNANGGYHDYKPRWNRDANDGMAPRRNYRPSYGQNESDSPQRRSYRPSYNREDEGNRRPRPQRKADNFNRSSNYSHKKRMEYKEVLEDPMAPVRLNKFLANSGICSRREADEFIQAGVITVNGKVVTELGTKVLRTDDVRFHDQAVSMEHKVYVLLNKPKDCLTTSDDPLERKTVMQLLKDVGPERIYPVGRLDRNTTGVLLLTNDGELATKLTHPKYQKKKIYHVYCDKNVSMADMDQMLNGVVLDDGEIHADAISYASETDKSQVGIEIHSGKNRIVRRIFEHFGYKVVKLDRVYFAGLTKKGLRRGDWRYLTEMEVNNLRRGSFE